MRRLAFYATRRDIHSQADQASQLGVCARAHACVCVVSSCRQGPAVTNKHARAPTYLPTLPQSLTQKAAPDDRLELHGCDCW